MQSSPFRKIIIPALLASSTVFAALTLPMTSIKSSDRPLNSASPLERLVDPLRQHQKEFFIRYIGFSIVLSAGSGLLMAEVLRRQHQRSDRHHELIETMETPESEDICWTAKKHDLAVAVIDQRSFPSDRSLTPWTPAADQATVPAWESRGGDDSAPLDQEWAILLGEHPPAPPTPDSGRPQLAAAMASASEILAAPVAIAADPTYRIRLGEGNQRLLAIQHQGDFYSFLRIRPTQTQAEKTVSQLQRQGKRAIFLPHERGYSVWVHQPHAYLDSPAPDTLQAA